MTKRKSDVGPEREDGEARGVSDEPTPGTMAWLERYPPDAEKWARVPLTEGERMTDEPRPPGEGWWKMWGEGSLKPAPSVEVEMWHHSWQGVRCLDEFPEGSSIKGIWWRPVIARPIPAAERAILPSWARQPMIDSAAVKHRIVHAWLTDAGTLFTLGSNGRIHRRDSYGDWHEITAYPPGLEP